jgi:NosR/NirI family nitrous oxide reductase transcriptional regulator
MGKSRKPHSRFRSAICQTIRVAILCAIVVSVRQHHSWFRAQEAGNQSQRFSLTDITATLPEVTSFGDFHAQHGGQSLLNAQQQPVGMALQTSPIADDLVGYSGPTNLLLVFDKAGKIASVSIVSSGDTAEHVADCVHARDFWRQFQSLTWDEAAELNDIDAVSGATLTSLAIFQSVKKRLGGSAPSILFPRPLVVGEVEQFFPEADRLTPHPRFVHVWLVESADGETLGQVTRTSPAGNGVIGFAGPTDTLLAFNNEDEVLGFALRSSMDNPDYIKAIGEEDYFLTLFNERPLDELAKLDVYEERVEGVSGATMTSQAMAESLGLAAKASRIERTPRSAPSSNWKLRDVGTVLAILSGCLVGFTRLKGVRWLRRIHLLVMVAYLGFLNGDVLSQALMVGWAQNGLPWRVAPGLVLLTLAALVLPVATGRQIYCSHVCPFGAVQQLTKGRGRWQWRPGRRVSGLMKTIPIILLAIVVVTATRHWPINLAGIEPFDAFAYTVAGIATILIAITGLIWSFFTPMAYCRYGCPTGVVLDYARTNSKSDRLGRRDVVAIGLLLLALVNMYF